MRLAMLIFTWNLGACATPERDPCAPAIDTRLVAIAPQLMTSPPRGEVSPEVAIVEPGRDQVWVGDRATVRWEPRAAAAAPAAPSDARRPFTGTAFMLRVEGEHGCPFVAVTESAAVALPPALLEAWRGQRARITVDSGFFIDGRLVGRLATSAVSSAYVAGPRQVVASALGAPPRAL